MYDKNFAFDDDKMTVEIGNREIIINSGKFLRAMNTIADSYSIEMPWLPGEDEEIDELTRPFGYEETRLFIGSKLQMNGIVYTTQHKLSAQQGNVKIIEGFTKTVDLIDSTVRRPYEANNIDIYERCDQQCTDFEIGVQLDDDVDIGGKFPRMSAEQDQKIFDHLRHYASLRGLLLSCNIDQELLITQAKINSKPVGTITEDFNNENIGDGIADNFMMKFDGRKRWKYYEAVTSSSRSGKTRVKKQSVDDTVPLDRYLTFRAESSLPGAGNNAAIYRRNKAFADSLTFDFPVNSWYDPDDDLWQPNTSISIISPTLGIENPFTFLIQKVEFMFDAGGTTAILGLVPPFAYSLRQSIINPWG